MIKNIPVHQFTQILAKQLQKKKIFLKQIYQIYKIIQKKNIYALQKHTTRKTFSKNRNLMFLQNKTKSQRK
jgi:hypothetical protein